MIRYVILQSHLGLNGQEAEGSNLLLSSFKNSAALSNIEPTPVVLEPLKGNTETANSERPRTARNPIDGFHHSLSYINNRQHQHSPQYCPHQNQYLLSQQHSPTTFPRRCPALLEAPKPRFEFGSIRGNSRTSNCSVIRAERYMFRAAQEFAQQRGMHHPPQSRVTTCP